MNSPKTASSPTFKNLKLKQKHSPVELKEKMRKNYKDKVQNCRNMLLNRFRGTVGESDIRNTLTDIYKSMVNFSEGQILDDKENEIILEEIKKELVQEELEWWLQEYEKSQMENIDWSSMECESNVICLICQKTNFSLQNAILTCPFCKISIKSQKSLLEIKNSITNSLERHNMVCCNEVQFTVISQCNETHIYLICESCVEMQCIV